MKFSHVVAVAGLVIAPISAAMAQVPIVRTQTIDVTVQTTDVFTLSTATPTAMSVAANNTPASFSGGTYSVSSNAVQADARDITVSINSLITGVTVDVSMAYGGTNGTSAGFVNLAAGGTSYNLVTGIYASSSSDQAITYRLTVPPTTAAFNNTTKTVTFTLLDAP